MAELAISSNAYDQPAQYDLRDFKRGDIYLLNTDHLSYKPEQIFGSRRVLVISNDISNKKSWNVIVAIIRNRNPRYNFPFRYEYKYGKNETGEIFYDLILTVDKTILGDRIGCLPPETLREADNALLSSYGLSNYLANNIEELVVVSRSKSTVLMPNSKYEERVTYEILLKFKDYTHAFVTDLERLKRYNSTITEETGLDVIQKFLDCCRGIKFLFQYSS